MYILLLSMRFGNCFFLVSAKSISALPPSLVKIGQQEGELQKAKYPDEPGDVNEVFRRKVHPAESV